MRKDSKGKNLSDVIEEMQDLLSNIVNDLDKSIKGNKAASQRVRTGTVKLEKVAKNYRKESILAEKHHVKPKAKAHAKAPAKSAKAAPAKAKAHAKAPAKAAPKVAAKSHAKAPVKAKPKTAAVKAKGFAVKRPTAKLPTRSASRK